jgi:hypothetical protein
VRAALALIRSVPILHDYDLIAPMISMADRSLPDGQSAAGVSRHCCEERQRTLHGGMSDGRRTGQLLTIKAPSSARATGPDAKKMKASRQASFFTFVPRLAIA